MTRYERIFAALDNAINDIFLAEQETANIPSGDISFEMDYDLNRAAETLATIIAAALAEQEEEQA